MENEKTEARVDVATELFLRSNAFRRSGGQWSRENLCAGGIATMTVRPVLVDGATRYECTVQVSGREVTVVRDADGVLDVAAIFLVG